MKIRICGLSSDINRTTLVSERTKAFFASIEKCLGEKLIPSSPDEHDADLSGLRNDWLKRPL